MNEQSDAGPVADGRPTNCRFRLQDEGKPYPRSSCQACGATITTGLGTYCTRPRPALAQSDAEPVAWQTRRRGSVDWRICIGEPSLDAESYETRPLYTAPSRPDASDAQPVGWQYRCRTNELSTWSDWRDCDQELAERLALKPPFYQVREAPQPEDISDEARHSRKIEDYIGDASPPVHAIQQWHPNPILPDASGLIEAAEFTDHLFSLAFDRCEIDTCEIMELGEKLGLLERVAYESEVHGADIEADEGDMIFMRSAKGKALRSRAADRSGKGGG